MMRISIKKDPRYRINTKKVRLTVKNILKDYRLDGDVEMGIVFVGKRKAKDLNIRYRKMDYIPEVLAFPSEGEKTPEGFRFLGDIVLCYPSLREKAIAENQMVDEATEELLRHGIKNLF